MATYAHLSGNTVINVLVANSDEDAALVTGNSYVEYTDSNKAKIGDVYDPVTKSFTTPSAGE